VLSQGFNHLPGVTADFARCPVGHGDSAITQALGLVGDQKVRIDLFHGSQTLADRAGSMGGIERKGTRFDLNQQGAMLGAGEVFGKLDIFRRIRAEIVNGDITLAISQRGFNRVGQAGNHAEPFVFRLGSVDHNAIDDGFNRMFFIAIDVNLFIKIEYQSVHSHASEAAFADLIEQGLIGAFAFPHHRRQHKEA